MRFLCVDAPNIHTKNLHGYDLLAQAAGATVIRSSDPNIWKEAYALVWIPIGYIHSDYFPQADRLVYGPHNFVFPEKPWTDVPLVPFKRSVYTCLSPWLKELYSEFPSLCLPVAPVPFPVDVETWAPTSERNFTIDCFLYFKDRHTSLYTTACVLLNELGLSYEVLVYGNYTEAQYRSLLGRVRFGVWVGRHESQGFALQEALAMDVPLVVWEVESVFEEVCGGRQTYASYVGRPLHAQVCSYWDTSCGLRAYNEETMRDAIRTMHLTAANYHPRAFVVSTLSPSACWDTLLKIFDSMRSTSSGSS